MYKVTFENLVNAANAKGLKFEAYSNVFDCWDDRASLKTTLSIKTSQWIWVTWTFLPMLDNECNWIYNPAALAYFTGRYSQTTGKTIASYRQEIKSLDFILK